jgi:hypothetical protein
MAVVRGGRRAQNITMFNARRWEEHVLLPVLVKELLPETDPVGDPEVDAVPEPEVVAVPVDEKLVVTVEEPVPDPVGVELDEPVLLPVLVEELLLDADPE